MLPTSSSMEGRFDSGAYCIITGEIPAEEVPAEFASKFPVTNGHKLPPMIDMRAATDTLRISGNFATFTGFKSPENSISGIDRIDFVFGSSGSKW